MPDASFAKPSFGTDGLRGRAGVPPLDPETMQRIGAALGLWLQQHGPEHKRVILGHDGRESAAWIEACLTQGLAATEVSVIDAGLVPTPGLAYLARTEPVQAGIMISASHNPSGDNGIKIFVGDGTKLADTAEREIADLTPDVPFQPTASARSKPRHELTERYQEHLANLFPNFDLGGRRIVVDAANGAGAEIAPSVLRGFGAEVIEIACTPDGTNINTACGALHPEAMAAAVREHGAAFGLSLDGDGDRSMFADETGRVWDGDGVLTLMGGVLAAAGELPGNTCVATVMSNLGLHQALRRHGVTVLATPVGDRAVVAAMAEGGYMLGGEQSGHIIFGGDGQLTGDGLYTGLRLMAIPGIWDRGFAAAFAEFESFPQLLVNVPVRDKPDLEGIDSVQAAVARVEAELGEEGRVVLRYSGTEDLCRVMVEGPTEAAVQAHTAHIVQAVERELWSLMPAVALAITASARAFSIALRRAGEAASVVTPGDTAAGQLHAVIDATCHAHGVTAADIDEIRLDLGPGSYTGLRVAVTFARTVMAFRPVTTRVTTSLQLMARAAVCNDALGASQRLRPILDARRNRFHHALVDGGDNRQLEAPHAVLLDQLAAAIQPGERLIAAGELHNQLRAVVTDPTVELMTPAPFDAGLLFDDGVEFRTAAAEELEPLYLMGSYAE